MAEISSPQFDPKLILDIYKELVILNSTNPSLILLERILFLEKGIENTLFRPRVFVGRENG